MYPAARPLVTWMVRVHEIENLKLLWRAAVRGRAADWRVLAAARSLGAITFESRVPRRPRTGPPALGARRPTGRLRARCCAATRRTCPAAEIGSRSLGLDGPARGGDQIAAARSGRAADLARLLILEHDLDLLRRGTAFGLERRSGRQVDGRPLAGDAGSPALARGGGVAARRRSARARAAAACSGDCAPRRPVGTTSCRRARGAAPRCRRTLVGWPFQLAPATRGAAAARRAGRAAVSLAAARAARVAAPARAAPWRSPRASWSSERVHRRADGSRAYPGAGPRTPPRRRTRWRAAGLLHLIDISHGRTDAAPPGSQELLVAHRALRDRLRRTLDRLGRVAPPLAPQAVDPPIQDFEVERQRLAAGARSGRSAPSSARGRRARRPLRVRPAAAQTLARARRARPAAGIDARRPRPGCSSSPRA